MVQLTLGQELANKLSFYLKSQPTFCRSEGAPSRRGSRMGSRQGALSRIVRTLQLIRTWATRRREEEDGPRPDSFLQVRETL